MNAAELDAKVLGICREVLGVRDLEIEDGHAAKDLPNYDSLAHIQILVRCQRAFEITLTALEAGQIANIGELKDLVRRKVANKTG